MKRLIILFAIFLSLSVSAQTAPTDTLAEDSVKTDVVMVDSSLVDTALVAEAEAMDLEELDGDKIRADLQLNLGFYYRLPYNDLIRFSILANYSFKDTFHGDYTFLQVDNAYGTYSYRHNHIGFELAYVHCFKKKARGKQMHNELLP